MKGGYQRASRLATYVDEIAVEAQVARSLRSKRERDRAFDEIQRLARASAALMLDQAEPLESPHWFGPIAGTARALRPVGHRFGQDRQP